MLFLFRLLLVWMTLIVVLHVSGVHRASGKTVPNLSRLLNRSGGERIVVQTSGRRKKKPGFVKMVKAFFGSLFDPNYGFDEEQVSGQKRSIGKVRTLRC